jgi:small subunit ribosomal protein S16
LAIKIRLKRFGRKKQPVYRVVIANSSEARNGQSIEVVGTYDPTKVEVQFEVKRERIDYWLSVGAKPTETVYRLLSKIGVVPKIERKSSLAGVARKDRKKDD